MILRILGLVVAIALHCSSYAQRSPIKFGDIPMDDMTMTVYPRDSSAEAVVLMDYGTSSTTRQD
jgi:hypothetical protein